MTCVNALRRGRPDHAGQYVRCCSRSRPGPRGQNRSRPLITGTNVHRVGGHVHRAWPHSGRAQGRPGPLAGPPGRPHPPPRRCRPRRIHGRKVSCRHRAPAKRSAHMAASASLGAAGPVAPPGRRDRYWPSAPPARLWAPPAGPVLRDPDRRSLLLRLLNWSWTYDSAVDRGRACGGRRPRASPATPRSAGRAPAHRRLDRVRLSTQPPGVGAFFRAGTIAWVGLAGAIYDQDFRVPALPEHGGSWRPTRLLTLQGSNGLIRGGPDVTWVSTQHNLLAYAFLARLGNELFAAGDTTNATKYQNAAAGIARRDRREPDRPERIDGLLARGIGRPRSGPDVQALGVMYSTAAARDPLCHAGARLYRKRSP